MSRILNPYAEDSRYVKVGRVWIRRVSGGTGPFGLPVSGAIANVSAAAVTPAFSGTPVAGEFLVGIALANNTGAVSVSGAGVTGWLNLTPSNNTSQMTIWYKLRADGGDPAPTFNSASATVMKAYLVRYAVVSGQVILDQQGTGTASASPVTATASAGDVHDTDLVICATAWRNNTAVTGTIGYDAGFTDLGNDGGSSSTAHISAAYQFMPTGTHLADSMSTSFTGAVTRAASVIGSFAWRSGQEIARSALWI